MIRSFADFLALAAVVLWPVIPLFWIPVHCAHRFFRRLGLLTYALPLVTWIPLAYVLFEHRNELLSHRVDLPIVVNVAGAALFLAGAGLQVWTLMLLTGRVITGVPEVSDKVQSKLTAVGPFSVMRHPTYLSHTMMFLGIFLLTGVIATAAVTVFDLVLVMTMIVPLEERELLERFGKEYEEYQMKVKRWYVF
jgi:protein-S-isoprenylcysteine O-methyltransferase Ste14